ncbi:exosortase family protein XrtF [Flavobacterium sp. CYK-55]|uniref:exosortase family protein XrtF n=1 Tax=Flavobacterium sp. CYK-55 TaxID=2835529 RepID=UPI001BCC7D8B|nr:exosortase family protein XrtF [Flavobacterium sp. CYK-55]MBS7785782.1 exosortase family protein XrtF [Flavobacterium sp. CYK-55]
MKKALSSYRPFFTFLFRFFATYAGLTILYRLYLMAFDDQLTFEVDTMTQSVAYQVKMLLGWIGYNVVLEPHLTQASIKVILEGHYVSRIVEGCNAMSVMILFTAFVIAFSGTFWRTLIFILSGCLVIHLLNVTRIALLSAALLHFPDEEPLLHGVVFPLFIYGVVFGLWVTWVSSYSKYATKKSE